VKVGNYSLRILRKLGEGGYSFVYLAEEILPETPISTTAASSSIHRPAQPRKYALKKVLAGEKEQLALAEREIEAMKRLPRHPNLLPLIEYQVVKAETYVVYMLFPLMEANVWDYVQDRLKSNSYLSTLEAAHIFEKLCHALHAMHSIPTAALSHRDVKPHNILLTTQKPLPPELLTLVQPPLRGTGGKSSGEDSAHLIVPVAGVDSSTVADTRPRIEKQLPHAVLMDFGSVAPAQVHVTSRTEALVVQEDAERHTTAPYRAPELWDVLSSCVIDSKVDIWAAGCVLYYVMVGETPFERTANEAGGSLMLAIVNGQWSWPAGIENRYPNANLRNIVDLCLQNDPAQRPSAAELLEKLKNI
jgi:serine/threonine kinase 16